jgi:hypothetical protein
MKTVKLRTPHVVLQALHELQQQLGEQIRQAIAAEVRRIESSSRRRPARKKATRRRPARARRTRGGKA